MSSAVVRAPVDTVERTEPHVHGLSEERYVGSDQDAVHMEATVATLAPAGRIEGHLHPFEEPSSCCRDAAMSPSGAHAASCGRAVLEAPQGAGIQLWDGQQVMLDAREIKNRDEIMLLNQAAAMVDGVYQDIYEVLKPGVRENDIVALATTRLIEMGSEQVEAINSIAGERCSPHPHVFSDRYVRPGDQAYFDIIHAYNGYRTCYYRTFAVGRATQAHRDAYKKRRVLISSVTFRASCTESDCADGGSRLARRVDRPTRGGYARHCRRLDSV